MMTVSEPVLEVRALSKRYRSGRTVVDAVVDASFDIPQRSIVALVGQSGSGKSTIARLLARLERPTSGTFLLNGRDIIDAEPRSPSRAYRRDVQMIFQDPFGSLNPAHPVGYTLARPLRIHVKDRQTSSVEELLETVGLIPGADFASAYPHELSGGQRQRVAVARALATRPKLILADEPTSMLDVSIRMGVLNLIERLRDERGLSYLYITHDLASARYISDSILVMYRGHLVEGGATEQVITSAAHPYTRLLLDSVADPLRPPSVGSEPPAPVELFGTCPYADLVGDVDVCDRERTPRHWVSEGHWIRCAAWGSGAPHAVGGAVRR